MSRFDKIGDDVSSASKSGLDALGKSAKSWGTGFAEFTKSVVASAQGQIDRSRAGWDALQDAKSLREAIEVHKDVLKSSAAGFRADASKIASDAVENTKAVVTPLASQLARVVKKDD